MEIWKDIIGFEGLYQVSNLGRVKSLQRIVSCGKGDRVVKERIKRISKHNMGYEVYNLFKNGKCYPHLRHRLIAVHFIPNPKNLPEINHKNGNKKDNSIENLEWCSYSRNLKHAYEIGLRQKRPPLLGKLGAEHPLSKPIAQYNPIGEFIKVWACSKDVWRELGYDHNGIRNCANGRLKTSHGFKWKFV